TAPRSDGLTSARCPPAWRTSGARKAARTTAYAAFGDRPPTWMPPIVTPTGSVLVCGLGLGLGFGGGVVVVVVVVVVDVVAVVVVSTVVAVVLPVVDVSVVVVDCADPAGTTAARTPAPASAATAAMTTKPRLLSLPLNPLTSLVPPLEDARIVRDHAVDPCVEDAGEVAVVVDRPGERGRLTGVRAGDRRGRDDRVVQHRHGRACAVEQPIDADRQQPPQSDERGRGERLEQASLRDPAPVERVRDPARDRRL